jgi:hypothetical protein
VLKRRKAQQAIEDATVSNLSKDGGLDPLSQRLREAYAKFVPPLIPKLKSGEFLALAPDMQAPPPVLSWDWRTRSVISTPTSQLPCNACTSFAISAAIEAALAIAHQQPLVVDPGYIHTCLGHGGAIVDANEDCRTGADLGVVLAAVLARGYASTQNGNAYPFPVENCSTTAVRTMAGYTRLTGPNSTKAAVVQSGPVVTDMWIWENFFDYRGQTPTYVPDLDSGSQQLHSVCIIGFDTIGWIIKNSFGSGWGIGGFATIAYGTCGLNAPPPPGETLPCQTYSIQLAPNSQAVQQLSVL